jgi:hypothetical protein
MIDQLLDILEEADLPAPMFRTAVRLARRTAPGASYVAVTYAEMAQICGTDSDNTVRGHLAGLSRVGLFTYQRNHAVHIWWKVIAERAVRASGDQVATDGGDGLIAGRASRALDDQLPTSEGEGLIVERASRALDDQPLREDEKIDRSARVTRAERAPRALDDHPIGRIGRMVGRKDDDPTYLPGGFGGADAETTRTELQQRAFALLTDAEIGLDAGTAAQLATRHGFELLQAHAFRFVRDRAAGSVRSPAIIATRLKREYAPGPLLAEDRTTELYRRHCASDDGFDEITGMTTADRRRMYCPPEYEGIILG